MRSDIEIAQSVAPRPIGEIAEKLQIPAENLHLYGPYKAKVDTAFLKETPKRGKLLLVTAIHPTPAGEGKTTVSVGLADSLSALGKKVCAALREPSLGPVFGIKGGAAGGGYAQVIPMEDLNLHFTGDIHAISAANNLLAAMADNSLYFGNPHEMDVRRMLWRRCMDMNDRQLRSVLTGVGSAVNGVLREDGFDITAASEVMAVLSLAEGMADLKERLSRLVVGFRAAGGAVTAGMLGAQGAMAALLRDALMPNLVQTLEGTPVFIHGGPFANIAHGCNSVAATKAALQLADYVVTEAGFGADLGAEKFINIKCRAAGLSPDGVVLVATVRALKYHGGADRCDLCKEDLPALQKGLAHLGRHIENIQNVYGLPVLVAINRFSDDTQAELDLLSGYCAGKGVLFALADIWAKGSAGGGDLARAALALCEKPNHFRFTYETSAPIKEKIETLVRQIYRGKGVEFTQEAQKGIALLEKEGYAGLPVCIAKTQYSFSDSPALRGTPEDFTVTIREVRVSAGAGFIVAKAGNILTMPGLPAKPAAQGVDVCESGKITGLF